MPADAENYRVQMIAEGKKTQTVEVAKAEAERIKKIGLAEATAIEVIGKAEAEKMKMKASVYKQYGDAAIMNIVLESLPKVSRLKPRRKLKHKHRKAQCTNFVNYEQGEKEYLILHVPN